MLNSLRLNTIECWLLKLVKVLIISILFWGGVDVECQAAEQVETLRREVSIDFKINRWEIDPAFSENSRNLDEIVRLLTEVSGDTTVTVESVTVWGAASPDGGLKLNNRLSGRRMASLRDYVAECAQLPDSVVAEGESAIPWETFRTLVADTTFHQSDEVLRIIGEGSDENAADVDRRLRNLRYMDAGRVWRILARDIFPKLRKAYVVVVRLRKYEVTEPQPEPVAVEPEPEIETVAEVLPVVIDDEPAMETVVPGCGGSWYLKTSLPAWASGVSNVAVERDLGCRWSVALDLAYSAWNYGKSTRKFRTFVFRPEARYWFGNGHNGLFAEAHLTMMAYNVALPGWEWRIQDRNGDHPALGGGVGVGFRMNLSRDGRWRAEGAVGAGVYHLNYDRFENRPNGPLHDTVKRTWVGIDHVALSVVYTINLNK